MCLMDNDTFDNLGLTFSVDVEDNETYNLTENGSELAVTTQNRIDYLLARVWFHLGRSLPIQSFVLGVSQRYYAYIFCMKIISPFVFAQYPARSPGSVYCAHAAARDQRPV